MTTIYEALWTKLGREPTLEETKAEVHRILQEARDNPPKKRIRYR